MPFKSYPGGVGVVAASYMRRTCCAIVDHDDDHYLGRLSVRTRLNSVIRDQRLVWLLYTEDQLLNGR